MSENAQQEVSREVDAQVGKFLTFELGNRAYGLEIRVVTEIIRLQEITPVPDVPCFIRGIINLRGKVIPVMDVRSRFAMPHRDYGPRTCIIVVNIEDANVGLLVDTVSEVVDIHEDQIEPAPKVGQGSLDPVVAGVGKCGDTVKILLNAPQLLHFHNDGVRSVAR